MSIQPGGNVGIGTTAPTVKLEVIGTANRIVKIYNNLGGSSAGGLEINAGDNSTGGAAFVSFFRPDGTGLGGIVQNGASAVAYLTVSDRRLKNIFGESQKGINDLMKIKIYDYIYKSDITEKKVVTGFVAQELYDVFPQSVSKPRENKEDSPEKNPWMVDYGSITPLIIRSVQDQQIIIDSLKSEIGILKTSTTPIQSYNTLYNDHQNLKTQYDILQKDLNKIMRYLDLKSGQEK